MALAKDRTVPSGAASFYKPTNMYDIFGSSSLLSPSPPLIHFPNFTSLLSPSPAGFYDVHHEDHHDHQHHYQRQLGLETHGRHSNYPCYDDDNDKFLKLQQQQVVQPFLNNHSPDLSSSSSANSSNGFAIHGGSSSSTYPLPHLEDQAQSLLINFKPATGFIHPNGASFLNFEQEAAYNHSFGQPNSESYVPMWDGSDINRDHQLARIRDETGMGVNLEEVSGQLQAANTLPSYPDVSADHDWLYGDAAMVARGDSPPESTTTQEQTCFHNKRAISEEDENFQTLKKPCTAASKKQQCLISKPKPLSPPTNSKDPQSVAAKNRRERISERLKVLQDLVPNGSKVDLVTMLEKAISYVKFLQLQVKVLATDDFWPVAGGKIPDISQVREAIDAILSSSQRNGRTSSPQPME